MPFLTTLLNLAMLAAWAALLVLNVWVWRKTKGRGNLFMIVGASVNALTHLISIVAMPTTFLFVFFPLVGIAAFVYGFFLSVQPMVQGEVDALRKKLKQVAGDAEAGSDDTAVEGADEPPTGS